jgi:hypothetical protein
MPFFELFDESLDINSTGNYELSVQAGQDELSYCILDSIRGKYIMLRSYTPESSRSFLPDQLDELMQRDDFLQRKYRQTHLVLTTAKSTLVPAALYDPARREEYFTFNHQVSEESIILTNHISQPESFLLFAVNRQIHEIVSSRFPGMFPQHHLKPLFHQIHLGENIHNQIYIHAHVEPGFFNLILFSNGKLELCNSFNYRNISDIIYYILNLYKSQNIGNDATIFLSGNTGRFDELTSNLSIYLRQVKFTELSLPGTFSYVFNDTEMHRYINLFSSAHCE